MGDARAQVRRRRLSARRLRLPARGDRAADLGSGCGIAPRSVPRRSPPARGRRGGNQEAACAPDGALLAEGNLPAGRFVPLCADLRELRGRLPAGIRPRDLQPALHRAGRRVASADPAGRIARHETVCTLADRPPPRGTCCGTAGGSASATAPSGWPMGSVPCGRRGSSPSGCGWCSSGRPARPGSCWRRGGGAESRGCGWSRPSSSRGGGFSLEMLRVYRKKENKGGRKMSGKLYVVGTPIGNLGDFSPRALETLQNCSFIAAEDTRVTLKLLNRFEIKKPLVSYYEHNIRERGQEILARILAGEDCAVVTDAGMPCISDPGEDLVRLCAENGVETVVVPGPSAAVSALAVSGLPTARFSFEGFLSVKRTSRMEHLEAVREDPRTLIFYGRPQARFDARRHARGVRRPADRAGAGT
ncbi:MAG: 16S rRNA (cytidine(1402)-2'-O)-methyltransferase [Anaerotruncus massiliensis (ex Togo et al. 2019)]